MTNEKRELAKPVSAPTENDYRRAADELLTWCRPLLVSHARPDGDALGCLLAMQSLLRARGLDAYAVLYEPCPKRYAFLEEAAGLHVLQGADDPVLAGGDGVVVMDTCAWGQLEPVADWLRDCEIPRLAIDHHVTRDDVADTYLIDERAAAASLLVYRLAMAVGWELPPAAAEAIFTGIVTDTGWFRYSNTSPECLRVSADLLEGGINADAIHKHLFLSDPASTLRARKAALGTAELHRSDTISIMAVSRQLLADAQATPADLEEVVGLPMTVASVEVSALLVETEGGLVKCSLRSKGRIDVARLAARLGGGGHPRAAGVRIQGTLDAARTAILNAIEQAKN